MVLTLGLLGGFKHEVTTKVFSFWGHIKVNRVTEQVRLTDQARAQLREVLQSTPEVDFFVSYLSKYGLLTSQTALEGVIVKGYDERFCVKYFNEFLQRGRWYAAKGAQNNEIVLSERVAQALQTDTGKYVVLIFLQPNRSVRKRKLRVVGIYRTGIEMYDKNFTFVPLPLLHKISGSSPGGEGSEYEVFLSHPEKSAVIAEKLYEQLSDVWQVQTSKEMFLSLFEWLDLLNVNQVIILVIMFAVAVMNMATCVVALVKDRVSMIGILKTLGVSNMGVQTIFLCYTALITVVGMALGNVLGVGLAFLQNHFQWLTLAEKSYFVQQVTLRFSVWQILGFNAVFFVLCFGFLILPSLLVYRQKIITSLRVQ